MMQRAAARQRSKVTWAFALVGCGPGSPADGPARRSTNVQDIMAVVKGRLRQSQVTVLSLHVFIHICRFGQPCAEHSQALFPLPLTETQRRHGGSCPLRIPSPRCVFASPLPEVAARQPGTHDFSSPRTSPSRVPLGRTELLCILLDGLHSCPSGIEVAWQTLRNQWACQVLACTLQRTFCRALGRSGRIC